MTIPVNTSDDLKKCRGTEAKQSLVANYFIAPICAVRLLEGQNKSGCCGELSDNYYLFSYQSIRDKALTGTFMVGETCAKEFMELVNTIRARHNLPDLTVPYGFDAMAGNMRGRVRRSLKSEVRDVLLLISVLWDRPLYGKLLYLLKAIIYDWDVTIYDGDLTFINNVLLTDDRLSGGLGIEGFIDSYRRKGLDIGSFSFEHIAKRLSDEPRSVF